MELLVDRHIAGVVCPLKEHGGGVIVRGKDEGAVGGDADVGVRCGRWAGDETRRGH